MCHVNRIQKHIFISEILNVLCSGDGMCHSVNIQLSNITVQERTHLTDHAFFIYLLCNTLGTYILKRSVYTMDEDRSCQKPLCRVCWHINRDFFPTAYGRTLQD